MSDAPNKKEVKKDRERFTNIIPADLRGEIESSTGVIKKEPYTSINEKFYKEDQAFITACEKVGIKPTRRQASKWRNQKGLAYLKGRF
jgi:hypothetical protein